MLFAAWMVYVVRVLALIVVLAALLLLVVAWFRPVWLARILASPRLSLLPARLRGTPLAFAGTVAVGALVLAWAASVPGGSASGATAETQPTPVTTIATAPATPSVQPPPDVTLAPTPKQTAEPMPTVASAPKLEPTGPIQVAQVVSITDGDTIRVRFGGTEYRVRYIGMDTPETHFGTEWLGPEAAQANANLVAGKQVVLEKDVSETDEFGRLLRYVWLHDDGTWLLVNLELLREGFAQVATYPPDVKYIDPWFLDAQRQARDAGIGLWAGGPGVSEPAATAAPTPSTPLGFTAGSCEPSYPDICIPIGAPDLDCRDISARRFRVLWDVPNPDPMRFDGERDGIGCES